MGSHEEGGALAESPRMTLLEETWPVVCDGLCMWGGVGEVCGRFDMGTLGSR